MLRNSTKVWLFICGTCFTLLAIGYGIGDRWGLLTGLLLSVGFNFLIFYSGENQILDIFKARPFSGQDPWGVNDILKEFAERLQIPSPHFYLIKDNSRNAFSLGFSEEKQIICLTEGLLKSYSRDEIRAVLAHQVCQIVAMNSFTFGVSSVLAYSIFRFAQFLDQLYPVNLFTDKQHQPFLNLLSPIGWLIVRGVVNEKSFLENDFLAAELTQNRNQIGEALWRLHSNAVTLPMTVPPGLSHLFIVNPEGYKQKNPFLKMHPKIETRLKALLGYYPI